MEQRKTSFHEGFVIFFISIVMIAIYIKIMFF